MSANSDAKLSRFARIGYVLGLGAWVIVGLFGFSIVLVTLLGLILPYSARSYLVHQALGQLLLNAVIYVFALILIIGLPFAVARWRKRPQSWKGLLNVLGIKRKFRPRHLGLLFACFAAYFATTIILSVFATLLPWYNPNQTQDIGFENLKGTLDLVLAFVALVILPPIAEELMFRGYFFGKVRARHGFLVTAVATSLLFGLVHLQWNVGIDTFALSIFLCYLREKTGAIWMSMGLHMLKNGLAYFFLFIAPLLGLPLQ